MRLVELIVLCTWTHRAELFDHHPSSQDRAKFRSRKFCLAFDVSAAAALRRWQPGRLPHGSSAYL